MTTVSIYQLHTKFVNQCEDIPEEARQVVYYSLAVGHHVGVMDCFSSLVEIPFDEFSAWVSELPNGPGKDKLAGVIQWGEIEVNRSHVEMLIPLFNLSNAPAWGAVFTQCLQGTVLEPALYLMVRKRA